MVLPRLQVDQQKLKNPGGENMSLVAVCVKDEILRRALCHMIIRMGHRTVNRAEDAEITVREDSDGSLTVITPTGETGLIRPISEQRLLRALITEKEPAVNEHKLTLRNGRIYAGKKSVALSGKEMSLMQLLIQKRGEPVSDEEIKLRVFGTVKESKSNVQAVYINYLRKKLTAISSESTIVRVRGAGYMLK